MLVLCAKRKTEKKERFYNGRCFVCGKSRAVDISGIEKNKIDDYIMQLYAYLETIPHERGTIDYYTKEI